MRDRHNEGNPDNGKGRRDELLELGMHLLQTGRSCRLGQGGVHALFAAPPAESGLGVIGETAGGALPLKRGAALTAEAPAFLVLRLALGTLHAVTPPTNSSDHTAY